MLQSPDSICISTKDALIWYRKPYSTLGLASSSSDVSSTAEWLLETWTTKHPKVVHSQFFISETSVLIQLKPMPALPHVGCLGMPRFEGPFLFFKTPFGTLGTLFTAIIINSIYHNIHYITIYTTTY